MIRNIWLSLVLLLICTLTVLGDTLTMKDGTSIQGRVIDQGDKYWLKDANGETHLVDKSTVATWTRGDAAPAGPASGTRSTPVAPSYSGSSTFSSVKARADACEIPIAAVSLWQGFIDGKPSAADLTAAKAELKHWQELMDGDGEKINGKWIWGDDRTKLLEHVRTLMQEGAQAIETNQTILGIQKFEEAVKLYPNNFEANFELGYYNLLKGVEAGRSNTKIDAGIKSMELAVKLEPSSAAALSDLSIAYNFKHQYALSVQTAYKAVKMEDSKGTVQNLINTISYAPPGMQNNSEIKPIMQEALILAEKYGISPSNNANWVWIRAEENPGKHRKIKGDEEKGGLEGVLSCGTGFYISANGYILTNRHVAKDGDYLVVRLPDNTFKLAERVVIDDEQDMAIIRTKNTGDVPFVKLADYDHPVMGADVAVFGFPVQFNFGLKASVKMTRGIVTAFDNDNKLCDVTVDAQVNPGNSGGPMIDRHGNLLALTAMKTGAQTGEVNISSYGLGYSNIRIRKFLKKQHDKIADANLQAGSETSPVLSNEELAAKLTQETILILACRGKPPKMGEGDQLDVTTKSK